MKKIALLTSYCDTNEKISILEKNINKLKSMDIDVMLISPINIDSSITGLCDFYFCTRENPILSWPIRATTFWKSFSTPGGILYLHEDYDDHGWAALYQTKKIAQIALTYDYDIFYHMIYDTKIDDNLIGDIKKNIVNRTYHRLNSHGDSEWKVNLHFLPLDRLNTEYLISKIEMHEYVSRDGFAEHFLENVLSDIKLEESKFPISDLVDWVNEKNFNWNYSKNTNYKIFLSRENEKYRFVVYDIKDHYIKKIISNGEDVFFKELMPITLPVDFLNNFEVVTSDGIDDYTSIFNSIIRNVIEIK